jgi:rhodanese-related sulfurtransferase
LNSDSESNDFFYLDTSSYRDTTTSPAGRNTCITHLLDPNMSVTTISPSQLAELCQSGKCIELIDVRTTVEFREVHLHIAKNVPLDQLDPDHLMQTRSGSASDPLYLICRSGSRGKQACDKFEKAGFTNIINVEGGTLACVEAGLPVVRGKKAMSLERQVRIAAGLMVILGVVLGIVSHEGFLGIAGFVGIGLVFAGITDTCGMGLILAQMPWNKCGKCESGSCQ